MTEHVDDIELLINQGRFFEARILAESFLQKTVNLRVVQLLALAMSKSGMPEPARDLLEPVHKKDSRDPETSGILGSIYKRLFKKTQDNKFAVLARATYQENFSSTRNYYTGINTAAMATISGKGSEGRAIAREVIEMLDLASEDFWEQATLGEAFLLSRDKTAAAGHYLHARRLAGKEWGKLQSVYDQLLLLNFFIAIPTELLKAFAPPAVVAFTGHMIDRADRSSQRFPASIEKAVKEGIGSAIRTIGASIGYSSLSCGSDILFAEAMAEAGGEVHLFLPFNREDYLRESVQFAGDHWVERFETLEKKFPVTYVTHESYAGNDDLFSFQNRVILGTVVLRAAMNFTTPTLLTVLSDTDIRQKEGGTRDTLAMWPYKDHHININPDLFVARRVEGSDAKRQRISVPENGRHVFYVVIADISDGNDAENESFLHFADAIKDHLLLKPWFNHTGKEFIVAFQQPVSALEIAKNISSYKKAYGHVVAVRTSMHTVVLNTSALDMAALSGALRFHGITPPNIPSAYGWFAAATTLSSESLTMEFAGIIGDANQRPNEVYNLYFKK